MINYQSLSNIHDAYIDITPQNVKLALIERFQMDYRPNAIECLTIVDEYLSENAFPDTPYSRRFAVVDILIEIISNQLMAHRQAMGISIRSDGTRKEAFSAIKRDIRSDNALLIGWSWLYYGYVRVDLDISQQIYAQKAQLIDRTLRRYQDIAFLRITEMIIHQESLIRHSHTMTSQTVLLKELTGFKMEISLKAQTIIELFRTDKSLFQVFLNLAETAKL